MWTMLLWLGAFIPTVNLSLLVYAWWFYLRRAHDVRVEPTSRCLLTGDPHCILFSDMMSLDLCEKCRLSMLANQRELRARKLVDVLQRT